jgi:hypothetical protein
VKTIAQRLATAAILGTSLLVSAPSQATSEVWDVLADPTNGFLGATPVWGLSDPDTAVAAWNVFNAYPIDTTPDVLSFGPAPQSVQELTGGAFLTGGGNIYSFAVATDFITTLTGYSATPGATRDVVLRLETLGTSVDLSSVRLNGAAPTTSSLLFSAALGGFGGSEEERLFVWDNIVDATSYVFDFNAAGSSMSLSQLAMYSSAATVVPLPAAGWLLISSLGTLVSFRRRFGRHRTSGAAAVA